MTTGYQGNDILLYGVPFGGDLISRLEGLLGASGYLWYADDLSPNWLDESDDCTGGTWAVSPEIDLTIGQADPLGGNAAWKGYKASGASKSIRQVFHPASSMTTDVRWSVLVKVKAGTQGAASDTLLMGIRDTGWNAVSAEVLSGPGAAFDGPSLASFTGLSTSEWTYLRIYTDDVVSAAGGALTLYLYPGGTVDNEAEVHFFRPTVQVYHDGYDTGQLHQTGATAGGLVASWADRIQSLAAVQATASKQPYVRWNQGTGRLEVAGDGVDDWMRSGAFASELAQPNMVYSVASSADKSDAQGIYGGSVSNKRHHLYRSGATGTLTAYAGAFSSSGLTVGAETWLGSVLFDGANSVVSKNGVLGAVDDGGSQGMTGVSMFSDFSAAGNNLNEGTLSLLGIEPTGDTAKRAQIETIINQLYNDIY